MSDYIISACAPADLTKEQFDEFDVKYIYFHYYVDDEHFYDDMGQTMSYQEFYKKMEDGAMTRTSQTNPEEFIKEFTPILESGKDILHISLSSGISGVYNSAVVAKAELEEQFPDRKIIVIDSLCASVGYGLFVKTLADMRKAGKSIDEVAKWGEENKIRLNHWVFVSDLKYLVRGGRLSKVSGALGSMLSLCPVIEVNSLGKLETRDKVRTKKKVIKELVNRMEAHAENGLDYSGEVFLSHSNIEDDAKEVARLVEERFPKMDGKVLINYIGTTIGSHTGPGTIALCFWGDERQE